MVGSCSRPDSPSWLYISPQSPFHHHVYLTSQPVKTNIYTSPNCTFLEQFVKVYLVYFCNFRWSTLVPFFFLIFKVYLFILREEESGGGSKERGRVPSRLCAVSTELDTKLELTNREIIIWVKIKSQTLSWLSHPGTPHSSFPKEGSSLHLTYTWSS